MSGFARDTSVISTTLRSGTVAAFLVSVLVVFALPPIPAIASASAFYLQGGEVPQAALSTGAPTASSLPNYDPGRDSFPGLLLQKTGSGAGESDPTKYQIWVAPGGGVFLTGSASLTFWSAMKDFETNKGGEVNAYLLDCSPSGDGCNLIAQGATSAAPWSPSGDWVARTINFGSVAYAVPSDRALAVKVTVDDNSGDDILFAYGTFAQPSALTLALGANTTTTEPTTTTTAAPITTTTAPITTTTAPITTTSAPITTTTAPITTTTRLGATTTTAGTAITSRAATTSPTTTTTRAVTTTSSGSTTTSVEAVALSGGGPGATTTTAPSPGASPGETSLESTSGALSMSLMESLELVVPPPVAAAILSPLLILEFLLLAIVGSFQAVTLPVLLLGLALPWIATREPTTA